MAATNIQNCHADDVDPSGDRCNGRNPPGADGSVRLVARSSVIEQEPVSEGQELGVGHRRCDTRSVAAEAVGTAPRNFGRETAIALAKASGVPKPIGPTS